MKLTDIIKEPYHETFADFKGDKQKARYPKGTLIARVDAVYLFKTKRQWVKYDPSSERYAVVYGAEMHTNLTSTQATSLFGACCIHQAECYGITE